MVDLLLSVSAWILLSSTIIPLAVQFIVDSINEKESHQATVILYEKLHGILIDGIIPPTHSFKVADSTYVFTSSENGMEVCIQFEDRQFNKKKVCEYLE
jgi:hypothetical protein